MRKIIAILTVALMLFGSFDIYAAEASLEKMYIFVKAGAEGGDGSKDNPYGTFEEARDRIREIKKNGEYPQDGIVVYFREGVYSITDTIKLTEEDSGTKEGPVVYRAYMEEQVTFVGGVDLKVSQFSKVTDSAALERIDSSVKDNILAANLKDFGLTDYGEMNYFGSGLAYITSKNCKLAENGVRVPTAQPPEVFFGDEVGKIARYPNDTFIKTGNVIQTGDTIYDWSHFAENKITYIPYEDREYPPKPSIFYVDDATKERMKKWKNEDDVWVFGFFNVAWSDNSLKVREYDSTKGIITTDLPSPKAMSSNKDYYIYNVLGELDAPGEYYLDRNTGVLYIYPTDPNGTVTFSNLNVPIMDITCADHVHFKSLSIKGTRKNGILIKGCDDLRFELCSISKAAGLAAISTNCINSGFVSCHIYQTGKGGIEISSDAAKSSPRSEVGRNATYNLVPQNNFVENCEIHDYARIRTTYSPGIQLSGTGNVARHNKLYNSDHYAIAAGGSDILIENNEFTNVLRTAADSGVIYRSFGKEKRGIVVRNNYFHDINSTDSNRHDIAMAYADDTASEWTVDQNLLVNSTGRFMRSNGGDSHTVTNNIVINADNGFGSYSNHEGSTGGKYSWAQYTFQEFVNNPAYAKYKNFSDLTPENYLKVRGIVQNNNVIWDCNSDTTFAGNPALNEMEPSHKILGNPGFVDMANGNYTLKEDSTIYKKFPDFKAPDFENMGMYTGKLKALLGENKAFYVGSPKVHDGWSVEAISSQFDVGPVIKDGVSYLPLRYITEELEGEVQYNNETSEITVNYASPVTIKQGEYISVNGTAFISTDMVANIFDKTVKVYENGVIIMGDVIRIEDTDTNIIAELARRLDNE